MSGYDNYSKSNNAVEAEARGAFPASKIARKLHVPVAVVRQAGPCEWHHTSSHYNCTDYYDLAEVREWLDTEEGKAALANARAARKKPANVRVGVSIEWLEWSGSRAHPQATVRRAANCRVSIKGATATITLPDGQVMRKRLATRGFYMRGGDGERDGNGDLRDV